MTDIDTSASGQRFGHLTIAYRCRYRVVARCCCGRLVHAAAESLTAGAITSCGCRPPSPEFWNRQAELRSLRRREIIFNIARRRVGHD